MTDAQTTETAEVTEAAEAQPSRIVADVAVPPLSRTFTDADVRAVYALLKGEHDSQNPERDENGNVTKPGKPAENVSFGTFQTKGAARSAGVTLNAMLKAMGADHSYAVSAREINGEIKGIMWNKPAKTRGETPEAETETAQTETPRRRNRRAS